MAHAFPCACSSYKSIAGRLSRHVDATRRPSWSWACGGFGLQRSTTEESTAEIWSLSETRILPIPMDYRSSYSLVNLVAITMYTPFSDMCTTVTINVSSVGLKQPPWRLICQENCLRSNRSSWDINALFLLTSPKFISTPSVSTMELIGRKSACFPVSESANNHLLPLLEARSNPSGAGRLPSTAMWHCDPGGNNNTINTII